MCARVFSHVYARAEVGRGSDAETQKDALLAQAGGEEQGINGIQRAAIYRGSLLQPFLEAESVVQGRARLLLRQLRQPLPLPVQCVSNTCVHHRARVCAWRVHITYTFMT